MGTQIWGRRDGDGEIIARSLKDPEAFVGIFDRHDRAIHAFLTRRAGFQQAEDLTAEVWLQAFKARGSFRVVEASALPWIYGIVRNVLRSYWRSQRSSPFEPPKAEDPWPDVDARLDALARFPSAMEELSRLDSTDREVLLLSIWEQLTPTEIASVLEIPPGTVRWRLHRARHSLASDNHNPTPALTGEA